VSVFLIDDADLFTAADDKPSIPRFNDNVGIASPEEVDKDRGLYVGIVNCPKMQWQIQELSLGGAHSERGSASL